MAYTCVMDLNDDKYIFSEFTDMVFKAGEKNIDSEASNIFQKFYKKLYAIVQNYRTSE